MKMVLFGGGPLFIVFMLILPFDPNIWQMALVIVPGTVWYGAYSLWLLDRTRTEYIQSLNSCANCGYNLDGLPVPQCPECGVVWSPWDPSKDTTNECNPTTDKPNNQI